MFCFKEINTFIQQGCNTLIKSEISIWKHMPFLNFLFIKKSWKQIVLWFWQETLTRTTVFNRFSIIKISA